MDEITKRKIERLLLNILDESKPHMMPHTRLYREGNYTFGGNGFTAEQFAEILKGLADRKELAAVPTSDETKYKILANGEARLLE